MDDQGNAEVQGGRTADTRMVVEAAIDVSNGANQTKWYSYRSKMSGRISPWRTGGFIVEERASSEFSGPTEGP